MKNTDFFNRNRRRAKCRAKAGRQYEKYLQKKKYKVTNVYMQNMQNIFI